MYTNKIINIDIVIMTAFIILLVFSIFNARFGYDLLCFSLPVIIIYTFIKSIFGIIILLKELVNKNKAVHGKVYLFGLLPTAIILFLCIYFWYLNFDFLFNELIELVPFISLIGLLMWLAYWTFYNSKIKNYKIILLDIISPAYLILFITALFHYGP